ncbi:nicotinate-nucleotide adenylyltransferase [Methylomonas sp. CM2]|uniref:nicotinate-nucleotide adenylyltransferase n=1 Tax=Methylomonas sp. CM2 TaxID=3417647 RepID=UPI003CF7338B
MIGVYGGTFNPVHYGHLRTALEVRECLELDDLKMIPCRVPAHRGEPDVSAEHRLRMLELAVAGTPGLSVDRRELDRPGPSYMVDTLQSLAAELPGSGLVLFVGADAFTGLEGWHRWRDLFDYAHIVVMTRPGFQPSVLGDFMRARLAARRDELRDARAGKLFFQAVTLLDIAATQIRRIIADGTNPRFLLPDAVLAYIQQHQLYRASSTSTET